MKIRKIAVLVLTLLCSVPLFSAVAVGNRGYTASAVVEPGSASGVVLEKGRIFKLEFSGGLYTLSVFDDKGGCAIRIRAEAPEGAASAAVQLERVHNQAQGQNGFRAILHLNGKRAAEQERNPLILPSGDAPLRVGAGFEGKVSRVAEQGRVMTPGEIRRSCGIDPSPVWRGDLPGVRYLQSDGLIMGLRTAAGRGNPLVGVYDKAMKTLLIPAAGLDWEIQYGDGSGIFRYIDSSAFACDPVRITEIEGGHAADIRWHNDSFEVSARWTLRGGRIETGMTVRALDGRRVMERISYPVVLVKKLPGRNFALLPRFSGVVKPDPTVNLFYREPYPGGECTMQLTLLYNDRGDGVYLAREDVSGQLKESFFTGGGGFYEVRWSVAVPRTVTEVKLPGKGVIERYRGEWFEGGQIYKKFARTAPWWIEEIPRRDTPKWFMDNPLWFQGFDINEGGLIRTLSAMRDYYEVPFGLETGLLYNPKKKWRFGPDFIYKDGFLTHLKRIRQLGIAVGPYYNARLCYAGATADEENNYSATGKRYAVKDEFGRERQENYGRTGIHSVMCPASAGWRKQLYDNISRLAEGGVDFIYHDQLPCGRGFPCFDAGHDHLVNDPDTWLAKGHWKTYRRVMTELRRKYPNLAHTGEDASEPYLNCIDGFMTWRFGQPGHVPLFHAVYSPRIQFVGRGGDTAAVSGTYESFFPRFGEQLVFNEQVGWLGVADICYPSPRLSYMKKLGILRYAAAGFLNSCEMLAPLKFRKKPQTMSCRWGVMTLADVTTDKILHCVWKHKDGRIMIIFLNTVNEKQSLQPIVPFAFRSLDVCGETGGVRRRTDAPAEVMLEPYGAAFWIFDAPEGDGDVKKIGAALRRTATVMSEPRQFMLHQRQDLSRFSNSDAVKAPLYGKDAQWMLFATRGNGKGLGFDSSSIYKPLTYNWIAAHDGAVISFGAAYLGENPESVEMELATDSPGVTVRLVEIGRDRAGAPLAEFHPTPGNWFDFRKYRVKWRGRDVGGRRWMVITVSGGDCNIRSWRSIEGGGK